MSRWEILIAQHPQLQFWIALPCMLLWSAVLLLGVGWWLGAASAVLLVAASIAACAMSVLLGALCWGRFGASGRLLYGRAGQRQLGELLRVEQEPSQPPRLVLHYVRDGVSYLARVEGRRGWGLRAGQALEVCVDARAPHRALPAPQLDGSPGRWRHFFTRAA